MSDIIERAQAEIDKYGLQGEPPSCLVFATLINNLIPALKAARAENERLINLLPCAAMPTNDLRARLADVLFNRLADYDITDRIIAEQLADLVLKLPGIAIMDREKTIQRLRYNSHDLGEFGNFIRLEYATAILGPAEATK